jgi:hypothetical protein
MLSAMDAPDNTLDAFPDETLTILASCDACGHQTQLDRMNPMAKSKKPKKLKGQILLLAHCRDCLDRSSYRIVACRSATVGRCIRGGSLADPVPQSQPEPARSFAIGAIPHECLRPRALA